MDRIEAIKAYKARQEQKAQDDANAAERHRADLALCIRGLKDRIQELIDTAKACVENGIPISSNNPMANWESGEFYVNSVSHRIGFAQQDKEYVRRIDCLGINGGGANGNHFLRTNGEFVICLSGRLPDIYQMEKFLMNFDAFEMAFYAYIDKILEK